MVNLITRMISMETIWKQCGECYFLGSSDSKISLEVV